MTKFIGIGHRKQQGKDTLANFLVDKLHMFGLSGTVVSFAGPLKSLCMSTFGLTHQQCYGTEYDKNSCSGIAGRTFPSYREEYGLDGAWDTLTARQVLQHCGLSMRKILPGIWANAPFRKKYINTHLVIIPDLRFQDEFDLIKQHQGECIRIIRPEAAELDSHEDELAGAPWDYTVMNDNSLRALETEAHHMAFELAYKGCLNREPDTELVRKDLHSSWKSHPRKDFSPLDTITSPSKEYSR